MRQEVQVTVRLTLEVDTEKTRDEVMQDVSAALHTLLVRPSSPVSGYLKNYRGGDTITGTTSVEVLKLKEEKDIYKNK